MPHPRDRNLRDVPKLSPGIAKGRRDIRRRGLWLEEEPTGKADQPTCLKITVPQRKVDTARGDIKAQGLALPPDLKGHLPPLRGGNDVHHLRKCENRCPVDRGDDVISQNPSFTRRAIGAHRERQGRLGIGAAHDDFLAGTSNPIVNGRNHRNLVRRGNNIRNGRGFDATDGKYPVACFELLLIGVRQIRHRSQSERVGCNTDRQDRPSKDEKCEDEIEGRTGCNRQGAGPDRCSGHAVSGRTGGGIGAHRRGVAVALEFHIAAKRNQCDLPYRSSAINAPPEDRPETDREHIRLDPAPTPCEVVAHFMHKHDHHQGDEERQKCKAGRAKLRKKARHGYS